MRRTITIAFLLVFIIAATGTLFARGQQTAAQPDEECLVGDLDDRYCDRTGNMVADAPLDESQWLDPDVLIFSYAPTEDPAVYESAWSDFIVYLEAELGRSVRWFGVRSYAAQVEAMRAGRLHISGFAAGAVQDAVNTAGFVPQTIMSHPDGTIGYLMEIWAHKDSDIMSVEDLAGRQVAFVSESSNSGYFAPRAILYEEFEMLPGEQYQTAFSGSHDNSALGVLNKDYDAAALASTVMDRMIAAGRLPAREEFARVLYESQEFPTTAYGVAHNLTPELQEGIRNAFLSFDWSGTSLDREFSPRNTFVPVDYQETWHVMRMVRQGSERVAQILGE